MSKQPEIPERVTIGLEKDPKYQFWNWLRENASYWGETGEVKIDREMLGGLFVEYLLESAHGGWDGFSSRDVTGINRFLEDLMLYYKAVAENGSWRGYEKPEVHFKRSYFTGSVTYPGSAGHKPPPNP